MVHHLPEDEAIDWQGRGSSYGALSRRKDIMDLVASALGQDGAGLRLVRHSFLLRASSIVIRQYRDGAHHRRAEIAVRVLYAPVRAGCHRLFFGVEMGMEAAEVDECARIAEAQPKGGGSAASTVGPQEEMVRTFVSGSRRERAPPR